MPYTATTNGVNVFFSLFFFHAAYHRLHIILRWLIEWSPRAPCRHAKRYVTHSTSSRTGWTLPVCLRTHHHTGVLTSHCITMDIVNTECPIIRISCRMVVILPEKRRFVWSCRAICRKGAHKPRFCHGSPWLLSHNEKNAFFISATTTQTATGGWIFAVK